MVWGSNPDGGEILHACPDWPWGPPSLLHKGYQVLFPGIKQPGHSADHSLPTSTEVNKILAVYLYSPSGPSTPVLA